MRIEGVESADERIAGVQARVLAVKQEWQSICLITIEAVIAPQGQVKTQENGVDQPAR